MLVALLCMLGMHGHAAANKAMQNRASKRMRETTETLEETQAADEPKIEEPAPTEDNVSKEFMRQAEAKVREAASVPVQVGSA